VHWKDRERVASSIDLSTLRERGFGAAEEAFLWPMTCGSINNNGRSTSMTPKEVEEMQSRLHEGGAWKQCPSSEEVLFFIAQDAAALIAGDARPETPASMRDLVYAKDVSYQQTRDAKLAGGFFGDDDEKLAAFLAQDPEDVQHMCGSQAHFNAHRARLRKRWARVNGAVLKEYHPLFLNQSPLHRRSLANASCIDFEGVAVSSYLYVKRGFQFFNLHVEQLFFTFVHYQATGSSEWIILEAGQMDKLDQLAASFFRRLWPDTAKQLAGDESALLLLARSLLFSKVMFPSI